MPSNKRPSTQSVGGVVLLISKFLYFNYVNCLLCVLTYVFVIKCGNNLYDVILPLRDQDTKLKKGNYQNLIATAS